MKKKQGAAPDRRLRHQIMFRIDDATHRSLLAAAQAVSSTPSKIVRGVLETWLSSMGFSDHDGGEHGQ